MAKSNYISMPVIRRLPRYYRHLTTLRNRGINRVSSKELSENMGLTASQIRQDLNCFGGFGQQGYGYMVDQLRTEIGNIMGIQNSYKAIILGAGNLGHAVTVHLSFEMQGFVLTGIFDNDPQKIGTKLKDHTILDINDIDEFYQKVKPDMAVLCVPQETVPALVDKLYSLGIKNYWNFSHYDINPKYSDAIVEAVHLGDSLMTLCYRISENMI